MYCSGDIFVGHKALVIHTNKDLLNELGSRENKKCVKKNVFC